MIRHVSLFSQRIAFFNRNKFQNLVMRHKTERYSKGFKSWDQFVPMLFCQVAQAKSLREISDGLACCMGKLHHLGISQAPSKSTLSNANKNRPWNLLSRIQSEQEQNAIEKMLVELDGCEIRTAEIVHVEDETKNNSDI